MNPRSSMHLRLAHAAAPLAVLLAALGGAGLARAAPPVSVGLQIVRGPADAFGSLDLSGTATLVKTEFLSAGGPLYVPIGSFEVALAPGALFAGSFIPTDPCVGEGSCPVGWLFRGFTGAFETLAFTSLGAVPGVRPDPPPIVPVGTFMPGDPCIGADGVCRAGGPLVAYGGTPLQVASWNVSIQAAAVPEPDGALLALFGLGGVALARRRASLSPTLHPTA